MRKFSEIKDNIFTTKVYEIIFPENAVTSSSHPEVKTQAALPPQINFPKLNHLFIVMELQKKDLK